MEYEKSYCCLKSAFFIEMIKPIRFYNISLL